MLTRRRFIAICSLLFARAGNARACDEKKVLCDRLAKIVDTNACSRMIVAQYDRENCALYMRPQAMLDAIARAAGVTVREANAMPDRVLRRRLADTVTRDFARGQVVTVHGIVFSRTEVLLWRLAEYA